MDTIVIRSFAKLNLTFEILGNLPAGFHEVRTVFQSIDLADTLSYTLVETTNAAALAVELIELRTGAHDTTGAGKPSTGNSEHAEFPLDERNLIYKAATSFAAVNACGKGLKLVVCVKKKIPVAAGLAGGSGNAAATLKAMQLLFSTQCSSAEADLIASALGSDINFCLHGGTQVGTGRGEVIEPVENAQAMSFLIVKPRHIAISTPWIFKKYDESMSDAERPMKLVNQTELLLESLSSKSKNDVFYPFFNAFENVCFESHPEVRKLRDLMIKSGCLSANITGSGPTLFGLVRSPDHGSLVQSTLSQLLLEAGCTLEVDCWVTESKDVGLEVCKQS